MFKNWRRNTDKELKLEYFLEWTNKSLWNVFGNVFPEEDDFIEAYNNAEIISVDKNIDRKISYRSRTSDRESLKSLLMSYRSWPEFRNDKTIEKLYSGLENGDKMPMPIIISQNGKMRIFGGNTRMDAFFHLYPKGKLKAVLIEV